MKKSRFFVTGVLILLTAVTLLAAKIIATRAAQARLSRALSRLSHLADFHYDHVSVALNLFDIDVHVHELVATPIGTDMSLKIGRASIMELDQEHDFPHFASVVLHEISGPPALLDKLLPDGKAKATLSSTGSPRLDFALDYTFDAANQRQLTIERLEVIWPSLGVFRLTLAAFDIPEKLEDGFLQNLRTLAGVKLQQAEAAFTDDGLIHYLVIDRLAEERITSEEFLQSLQAQLRKHALLREPHSRSAGQLQPAEVSRFIEQPKSLTLTLQPKVAIPLSRFITDLKLAALLEREELRLVLETGGASNLKDGINGRDEARLVAAREYLAQNNPAQAREAAKAAIALGLRRQEALAIIAATRSVWIKVEAGESKESVSWDPSGVVTVMDVTLQPPIPPLHFTYKGAPEPGLRVSISPDETHCMLRQYDSHYLGDLRSGTLNAIAVSTSEEWIQWPPAPVGYVLLAESIYGSTGLLRISLGDGTSTYGYYGRFARNCLNRGLDLARFRWEDDGRSFRVPAQTWCGDLSCFYYKDKEQPEPGCPGAFKQQTLIAGVAEEGTWSVR